MARDRIEAEWQFDAPDLGAVSSWLESAAVPGYEVQPSDTRELNDLYFEAGAWRFRQAGFTARLRDRGDCAVITLKAAAELTDGMRRRREVEEDIPSPDLAVAAAAPGDCGHMIRLIAGRHGLRPLFHVRTRRRRFELWAEERRLGEIAVDDTSFAAPGTAAAPGRMSRVEVEVDPERVESAQRFVEVLAAAGGLSAAGPSKFEAGLVANGITVVDSPDFGPTTVTADLSAGEVAMAILRRHLTALVVNEPGTRLGEDIEALHDMRVAARRLRAALAAFAPFLPPSVLRFRPRIAWIGSALGEVRDLDVHLEELAEIKGTLEPDEAAGLAAIEAILRQERDTARLRMLRALDSRRYWGSIESFAVTLRRGPARSHEPGWVPVTQAAPGLLRRRYRGARKLGDRITPSSLPADYHALRIAMKKLRYALEFLSPIYGRRATRLSERVTALQELLGRHQDLEVAVATLRRTVASRSRLAPAAFIAVGVISERHRAEGERLRRGFPPVYRRVAARAWDRLEDAFDREAGRKPAGRERPPR